MEKKKAEKDLANLATLERRKDKGVQWPLISGTLMQTLGLEKELEQSGPGNMVGLSIVSSLWLKGQGGSQTMTSVQDEASPSVGIWRGISCPWKFCSFWAPGWFLGQSSSLSLQPWRGWDRKADTPWVSHTLSCRDKQVTEAKWEWRYQTPSAFHGCGTTRGIDAFITKAASDAPFLPWHVHLNIPQSWRNRRGPECDSILDTERLHCPRSAPVKFSQSAKPFQTWPNKARRPEVTGYDSY